MDAPRDTEVSPGFRDSDVAPFVYFDTSSAHGVIAGAIQIELVSRILVPLANGGVRIEYLTSGRLRCSPTAIKALRNSIDKALEMLTQPQTEPTVGMGPLQ